MKEIMDLRNKKNLVTDADGFIGSHLTEKMVEKGYRVKAFVFYNAFNSWGWLDHSPRQVQDNLEVFAGAIAELMDVEIQVQSESQCMRPEKSEVTRLRSDNGRIRELTEWVSRYGGARV